MRLFAAMLLSLAPLAVSESIAGLWDATVTVNGLVIPFRFELSREGANDKGPFFNGEEKFTSTSGRFATGSLALNWDYTAARLEASFKDGLLEGTYTRDGRDARSV